MLKEFKSFAKKTLSLCKLVNNAEFTLERSASGMVAQSLVKCVLIMGGRASMASHKSKDNLGGGDVCCGGMVVVVVF